jgi:hypothetical protein
MSIVQALIGSIVSNGSGGGGGGGGNQSYPDPGSGNYVVNGAGGFGINGTAYDPGGAVNAIAAASTGWRRVTSTGQWSYLGVGGDDNPSVFDNELSAVVDAYGGFGVTGGADNFSMEWKGYIKAVAGSYHNFYLDSDDVAMFWIGNAALNPTQQNAYLISNNGTTYPTNSLLLTEDKWYPIRMRFQEWAGAERCQVFYSSEGGISYGMIIYFNAGRLQWNGANNGYGSTNSEILHLGSADTNVFPDTGNIWVDSSPAKNNAILVNAPTWLPTDAGGVFRLDGTDYFNVPTLQPYNDPQATISMWFNLTSDTAQNQTLISKELTFKIRIAPGGAIQVYAGNGLEPWVVNSPVNDGYTYGEWTNLTVTISNSNVIVYKNGQELYNNGGVGTTLEIGPNNFPFNIGAYSNGSEPMTGKVGEVKYYTGVKTAQEIADYYTATAARYGLTP